MKDGGITLADLDEALNRGELCFWFQPKVAFRNGRLTGGEALLRWVKPDGTVIPPGAFLPLAERSGFITDISAVMLPILIDEVERLTADHPDLRIAFNVSARDLKSPYLVKMLRSFIGTGRIRPVNLQVEITETAVVDNSERIRKGLFGLMELGVGVAMDDYGTGYSSLDLLSRLPFTAIKLDLGVIQRMARHARNTAIVRSTLFMARELGLDVVAEGIETEATYTFLMASGCTEAQGFWMGRPMPRAEFAALLAEGPGWPSSPFGFSYNTWAHYSSYRRKVLDLVYALLRTKPAQWGELPRLDLNHDPSSCQICDWFPDGNGPEAESLQHHHRGLHEAGQHLESLVRANAEPGAIRQAAHDFLEHSLAIDREVARLVEGNLRDALAE